MATTVTDVIDRTIGSCGKYQAFVLFLMFTAHLQPDWQLYNIVFILPKHDYVCMDDNAKNVTNHCPCENPKYDDSEIVNSVTSEWNLICERKTLASLSQSMLQLGILPGSLTFGYLSDRYGRKLMSCVAFQLCTIFVSLSAFVPYFWIFLIFRFLSGIAVAGAVTCNYIYIIEITGTSFRTYTTSLHQSVAIFGYLSITCIAYFIRRWRYILIVTGAPWILTVAYFWILPESPRWLITVGRKEEAIATLTKIARRNGLPTENIVDAVNETMEMSKIKDDKRGSITDLFRTRKMRRYSICIALVWIIVSHTFYAMNQYIGFLQGNLYLNTTLSALCLVPSIPIFIIIIKYLKRRLSLLLSFLMTSLSLLAFILTRNSVHYLNFSFVVLGHLGAYLCYAQIYLYTSEVFPTVVRNSALGFVMTMGRFGSFLAPYDVNIGIEWVTFSILIILPLIASMLLYFLPETKDMDLQNTMEQAEQCSH